MVKSELVTIDKIIRRGAQYNIPRYQRLYVWENHQVENLFEDLYEAFRSNKEYYYLGGILLVSDKENGKIFELIDGQQRFTTLWLLSVELGGRLKDFSLSGNQLRLLFSIRENVKQYFESALKGESSIALEDIKENSSLSKIVNARNIIQGMIQKKLESDPKKINQFSNYIRHNLQLLVTEVPKGTDLNKLFEVINNRGLQLKQDEILKARILNHIKRSRAKYAKIWNACSEMDRYIERGLRKEIGANIISAYDKTINSFHLPDLFRLMDVSDEQIRTQSLDLLSILKRKTSNLSENDEGYSDYNEDEGLSPDYETTGENEPVRSILTFPQLLLHTLRIYLYDQGLSDIQKIDEKDLLKTFEKHIAFNEENSISFIKMLLDVRLCFDSYVIKWVEVAENEKVHMLKKMVLRYSYFRREKPEANDELSLLQSMLYHSQQKTTQYWLTPYLYKAMQLRDVGVLSVYLRHLDNHLFSTNASDNTLPVRTRKVMNMELSSKNLKYDISLLDQKLGVKFPHYLFYKLDYVLWYLLSDSRTKKWKEYRMTAKNSIEHVCPKSRRENEKSKNQVSKEMIDDFGNLVLVSRGINSEYGNKNFSSKQSEFKLKLNFDSLKSALVFEYEVWNDEICEKHKEKMKQYLVKYFEMY